VEQEAGDDGRDRVELELERGDDAEVAAAAPDAPEEVGILLGTGPHAPPVGGDDVDRAEVVAAEAIPSHEPSVPTAEGEPGDTGGRHDSRRGGHPETMGRGVELAPGETRPGDDGARRGLDARLLDRRENDQDPA